MGTACNCMYVGTVDFAVLMGAACHCMYGECKCTCLRVLMSCMSRPGPVLLRIQRGSWSTACHCMHVGCHCTCMLVTVCMVDATAHACLYWCHVQARTCTFFNPSGSRSTACTVTLSLPLGDSLSFCVWCMYVYMLACTDDVLHEQARTGTSSNQSGSRSTACTVRSSP